MLQVTAEAHDLREQCSGTSPGERNVREQGSEALTGFQNVWEQATEEFPKFPKTLNYAVEEPGRSFDDWKHRSAAFPGSELVREHCSRTSPHSAIV